MNNELFEIIDPEADALKNTPEEEALRLADYIYPIKANTFRKPPEIVQVKRIAFKIDALCDIAHFINEDLKDADIVESALSFGNDFETETFESDKIVKVHFDADEFTLFLKWCEPREKDLFNQ
ncbi:hypothetical protein [uncultured Dysgonomonas sp.]|uniref:Uncharacterized protein n=1 Tax=uncultured Dysgonomonas sp. TaxID=206096 RepID=A0A212IX43_9BACT|nr:hypothetical protein [uncultured Dysgonomonas sp.]SBV91750.1 hypothetical protein KL86DYS1_10421 [uncultured Dysgonomonas sp.]